MNVQARIFLTSAVLVISVALALTLSRSYNATFAHENFSVDDETVDSLLSRLNEKNRISAVIYDLRDIRLGNARTISWMENVNGVATSYFAISKNGIDINRTAISSNRIRLRHFSFDPIISIPEMPAYLAASGPADQDSDTYIVQFRTQPIEEYRAEIVRLGGKIGFYIHDNAYLVKMDRRTAAASLNLPFIRWIGRYQAVYKMEQEILDGFASGKPFHGRFNIMLNERGGKAQRRIATAIERLGGSVNKMNPAGFRLEANLSSETLLGLANDPDVLFIDRWSPPESDIDLVRSTGGADLIESTFGYRGEGVRAEVMDNGLRQTHNDLRSGNLPLIHNSLNTNEPSNHGTSTYGIVFGRGTVNPQGRGMLPEGQGIFADRDFLSDRYAHTARLVSEPYNAVFQSNSWGTSPTQYYRTVSAELDDIVFLNDIIILQSQSNTGSRLSRPEAWAKNVVSVGGIYHYGTANFDDDRWNNGASHGPAADGRIKPDLAHFNDGIFTTSKASDSSYTDFTGTSAATPVTAGHFGIFYQMWHNSAFDNEVGATVFESRPHMTTAKAMMINTAEQWNMNVAGTDIEREHQGFGRVSLTNLNDLREKMLIVDETDVLTEFGSKTYFIPVVSGTEDPLKVTMVYADPAGNPASEIATVNDIDLKVTAPDGTVYWGNVGLGIGGGMWSQPGGEPNTVDTVENVFIEDPMPGVWRIEVIAAELNQDARPETPDVTDADFALVASGIARVVPTSATTSVAGRVVTANGRGINLATLTLTDQAGNIRRTRTGPFGYFRFDEVPVGGSYVLDVSAKRYDFEPSSRFIIADGDMAEISMIAEP